MGRLAPEKNLDHLTRCLVLFCKNTPEAQALIVGCGPCSATIQEYFAVAGLADRLHLIGRLDDPSLVDAYAAMDLFAFSSKSETQGMVLTEAMAAGVIVVALDAPGARDVLATGQGGILVPDDHPESFAKALAYSAEPEHRQQLAREARQRAQDFSMEKMANRALGIYQTLVRRVRNAGAEDLGLIEALLRAARMEWHIWANMASSAEQSFLERKP